MHIYSFIVETLIPGVDEHEATLFRSTCVEQYSFIFSVVKKYVEQMVFIQFR